MEPARWVKARESGGIRDSAAVTRSVKASDAAKAVVVIKAPA